MARFKCTNDLCSLKEKEIIVPQVRLVWNEKKQELISSNMLFCEECKAKLELISNIEIPILHFNEFDSMSPEQKRAVIRKRSSDHMRKTGEDKDIAEKKRQIIADNKRMVTGGK